MIYSPCFCYWVTIKPDTPFRSIETHAIVIKAGLGIVVLGRETVAEDFAEGAGLGDRAAEVIVLVGGDHVAGFIYVFRDVTIVVECGEVELAIT